MPTAELRNDRIEVSTTWNEKEIIKLVPGARWDDRERTWHVPLSWASCVTLRGIFGDDLRVGDRLNSWAFMEREGRVDPSMELRGLHLGHDRTDLGGLQTDRAKDLYDFQSVGVQWLLVAGDALLADDMGTGKTIQALTALREIQSRANGAFPGTAALPALVVCPNSVKTVWQKEAADWFPEARVYLVTGSAAQKQKVLDAAATDPHALVIINIEAVRTFSRLAPFGNYHLKKCRECDRRDGDPQLKATSCQVHPRVLNTIPFKTVIVDEAHRIKDPQSQQTRAVWALCHGETVERRFALTGTPLANDPSELWSIMHAVNRRDFPYKSAFVDRYCLQAWNAFGALQIVGVAPQTRDELFRFLDPRMRRMPKQLVLPQLPPKVRELRFVEMLPRQRRAYEQMRDEYIAELGDERLLIAPGNMAKTARLMQLASAMASIDEITGEVSLVKPSIKVDALIEIMEDLGDEPFVFCAEHRKLIELCSDELNQRGVRHGLITGAITTDDRARNLADFQSGKTRCLGFTIKAGGTGLTMTRAGTIVFLQRSWSMVDNQQAEDRVHRIGSEAFHESVNVIDVVTRGTIEEISQIPSLLAKFARLEEIRRDRQTLAQAGRSDEALDLEEQFILSSHLGG